MAKRWPRCTDSTCPHRPRKRCRRKFSIGSEAVVTLGGVSSESSVPFDRLPVGRATLAHAHAREPRSFWVVVLRCSIGVPQQGLCTISKINQFGVDPASIWGESESIRRRSGGGSGGPADPGSPQDRSEIDPGSIRGRRCSAGTEPRPMDLAAEQRSGGARVRALSAGERGSATPHSPG